MGPRNLPIINIVLDKLREDFPIFTTCIVPFYRERSMGDVNLNSNLFISIRLSITIVARIFLLSFNQWNLIPQIVMVLVSGLSTHGSLIHLNRCSCDWDICPIFFQSPYQYLVQREEWVVVSIETRCPYLELVTP